MTLIRYRVKCSVQTTNTVVIAAHDPQDAVRRVKRMRGVTRVLTVKKE